MLLKPNLELSKRNKQIFYEGMPNDCEVSKASIEIMLYRVCDGYTIDFPFSD